MTMEHARRLAAQDCPLPSLAGPALRLLVEHIDQMAIQLGELKRRTGEAHAKCYELSLQFPDIAALGDDGDLHCAIHAVLAVNTPDAVIGGYTHGWISTAESTPLRNTTAIYWHRSQFGGFPAIADEWRDEHHLAHASHWLPYKSPTPREQDTPHG